MKIPLLPLHIVTSKTIKEKEDVARADGVAEGKAFSNRQIETLLYNRAMVSFSRMFNRKQKTKNKSMFRA